MSPCTKRVIRIVFALSALCLAVAVLLTYLYADEIRKTLLSQLSGKITKITGQRVIIGDLALGRQADIILHDIEINNPDGYEAGNLLRIDRLFLSLKFSELLNGKFHFSEIIVSSPELSLSRDKRGILNVSERLRLFLATKSEISYRVDEFTLEKGSATFMNVIRYQARQVNLKLANLSSEQGTKTLVTGSAGYEGGTVGFEGWAYLSDAPKRFSVSASATDISLSPFYELAQNSGADAEVPVFALSMHVEGDTEKGIALTANGRIEKLGRLPFLKEGFSRVGFDGRVSYDISDAAVTIHGLALHSDGGSGAQLAGVIRDIREIPLYDMSIRIEKFDVAALDIPGGARAAGIVTSDAVHVKGKLDRDVPQQVQGTIGLTDASLQSATVDLKQVNARVTFDTEKELSVSAGASAKILRAGERAFHESVDITVHLTARGKPAEMAVNSSLTLSPVRLNLKEATEASIEGVHMETEGTLRGDAYSGRAAVRLGALQYARHGMKHAEASFSVDYGPGRMTLERIALQAEGLRSSAGRVAMRKSEGEFVYALDVGGLDIYDPAHEIEVRDAGLSGSVDVREKKVTLGFSVGTAALRGLRSEDISGSGRFSEGEFTVDIPSAKVANGRLRLSAQGKTFQGPFPVKADITAEGIDLASFSKTVAFFYKVPYSLSGNIKRFAFTGTLESAGSVHGNALIEGQNITVFETEKGRSILKGASFNLETALKGRDLEFRAEGRDTRVSARVSGMVREFAARKRAFTVHGFLPETKIADIRASLWDVLPDGLLYLGLEGSLSSDVVVTAQENRLSAQGEMTLKDIRIDGENGEYSAGPINGTIPIAYRDFDERGQQVNVPAHARSEFENLRNHYSGEFTGTGYRKISFGSFRYGFPLLDGITVWVRQQGAIFDIGRFDAHVFGGKLHGSGAIDVTGGLSYRLGVLLDGMSLKQLCDRIEPMRGYLSGKVDGIGTFKGSGTGLTHIAGITDFWTYRREDEETKISRDFLEKIGGPSIKTYLGDRPFSRGSMSLFIKDGYVVFRELELSNRNIFGVQDLSVKVAPLNNRIAIDHLLWSVVEAAERAKKE